MMLCDHLEFFLCTYWKEFLHYCKETYLDIDFFMLCYLSHTQIGKYK